jgi:hypothetical protein
MSGSCALLIVTPNQEDGMAKETLIVDLDAEMANRVRQYSREHGADVADVLNELISTLPNPGASNGSSPRQNGSNADSSDSDDWRSDLTPLVRSLLGAGSGDADEVDYHEYLLEKYGR